ncbi:hypothetical protein HPB47_011479, partial [Ixodes persulcatus]
HWLDPTKKIYKQMKGVNTFTFYFGVKFYAPDPCKLLEEITRYQFFLQVKQDIYHGRLPVAFDLAAELFALAIQSELGDYEPRRHQPGYASELRFLTNQTPELEGKGGRSSQGTEGEDHTEYFLGLTPSGVMVLRNKSKVGNYYWLTQSSENPIASNKFFGLGGKLRVRSPSTPSMYRSVSVPSALPVSTQQHPASAPVPPWEDPKQRSYELVDSEAQWKEVQKQQQENTFKRPQNAVVRDLSSRKSGYVQSGMETESEALYAHRRKNRRRYHLVDPDALTEEEKKDIKYTKVDSKTTRDQKGSQHDEEDGPPPPYTTVHSSPASRPSTTGAASTPQQLSEAAGSVLSYEPSPNLPRERDTFPRPLMTPPSAVNALASSASNGLVSSFTRGQLASGEPGFKSHDSRDPRIESQLSRLASRVATPPSASTDGSVPSSATNGFSSSATHGSALSAYPPNGKLPVFTSRASSTTNLLAPSTTVSGCMTTLANGGISYKSTAVRHTAPFSLNETSDLPVNGSSRLALTGIHQTPSGVRYGGCGETNGIHELSTPATNPGPRVSFQTPAVAGYSK